MRLPVLVVDDCEVVAAAVSRILERAGFAVWVAYSCDEARGLAAGGSFVVGVLDVQLGDGDGLQLARWLQEQGSVGEIVFHSGSPLTDQERASVGKLGTVVAKGASSKVLLGAVVEAARIELGRQLTALEQLQRSSEPPSIQRSGRAAPRTPPQRPARRARRAPRP